MGQSLPCVRGVQKGLRNGLVAEPATVPKSEDSSCYGDPPSSIAVAELGPDGLPSVGSKLHFSSECKRCAFFAKGSCQNGHSCQFCHFDHDTSRRAKKKRPTENGAAVLSTKPQAGLAVPAQMSGNPVTLDDLLRQSTPQQSTAPQEAQHMYWPQQQWGGLVQQWPYAEGFPYGDYMYYGSDAAADAPEHQSFAPITKDNHDHARANILAMVGAWDALQKPTSDSNTILEDPGVDTPPLSRDDLLQFRTLVAAQKAASPLAWLQETHGIRAVKTTMEKGSPEKNAGRGGMRKGKGRAAAAA